MVEYYEKLISNYPLVSIEDPLDEDEWDAWKALTAEIAAACSSSATTCSSPTPLA